MTFCLRTVEVDVVKEAKPEKRTVLAPGEAGPMNAGQVLSVELAADEDVEWAWSHDREGGSAVAGYKIVPRNSEHNPHT